MQVQKPRYGNPREAVTWLLRQPGVFEDRHDDLVTVKHPATHMGTSGLSLRVLGCLDYLKRHCSVILSTDNRGHIQATLAGVRRLML